MQNVPFQMAVSANDQITVFVQPEEFDHTPSQTPLRADIYPTDKALVVKVKLNMPFFFAMPVNLLDDIKAGLPVWISHLHPELGYVLPQAQIAFDNLD